jgi:hypothetical protein
MVIHLHHLSCPSIGIDVSPHGGYLHSRVMVDLITIIITIMISTRLIVVVVVVVVVVVIIVIVVNGGGLSRMDRCIGEDDEEIAEVLKHAYIDKERWYIDR